MQSTRFLFLVAALSLTVAASEAWAEFPALRMRRQVIDSWIQIGYSLAIADMDGDGREDILLADAKQIAWYRNPSWEKFIMSEQLTTLDHVCIAARDIDGDGKAEVAVGAGWNPNDTIGSGAIFFLDPPADRTETWRPVQLPHEPTVHRMQWVRVDGGFVLAVLPLHGRGNRNSTGEGVRFIGYRKPAKVDDPWPISEFNAGLHATHNFDAVRWNSADAREDEFLVASKEGVHRLWRAAADRSWDARPLTALPSGEVRAGQLAGGQRFIAVVEPMHGNELAVYRAPAAGDDAAEKWSARRALLDNNLIQAHALATGDLLGVGYDQVVVGWRGGAPVVPAGAKVGIKLFAPTDATGQTWTLHTLIDDNQTACEDLKLADLDRDGRLDLIAAGRGTKNVVIYWNETPRR